MIVIQAPNDFDTSPQPRLFLAGSIEMGAAPRWQDAVINALTDIRGTILNPRRDDWDSSWKQSITDLPFNTQVNWELDAQESADFIFVYFAPETKAPITLLELGLLVGHPKARRRLIVCCPDGFWRKGNVDIVCARHDIWVFNVLQNGLVHLRERLKSNVH